MTINTHVIVETNFLVELLHPLENGLAQHLFARHRVDLYLHIPWCCQSEAVRTLNSLIREKLGFDELMIKLAQRLYLPSNPQRMAPIQAFKDDIRREKISALENIKQRISQTCQAISIIKPSQEVIDKTLNIFQQKLLPPFDEMILGAVLSHAEQIKQTDPTCTVYFATLNAKDFGTAELLSEYDRAGIQYKSNFSIP